MQYWRAAILEWYSRFFIGDVLGQGHLQHHCVCMCAIVAQRSLLDFMCTCDNFASNQRKLVH